MSDQNENDYKSMVDEKDGIIEEVKANGLGKASMARFNNETLDSDIHLGWVDVNIEDLPSEGAFYPEGVTMKIRSARVAEIRHFSTLDEQNILDIEEKLNSIIKACVKVQAGTKIMSYKDVLEEDRIYLLLTIRDLTFPEPENKIIIKAQDNDGKDFDVELSTKYFETEKVSEEIRQYYDDQKRAFVIQTKSAGEVTMRPPSIGVMEEVTKFMQTRQRERKTFDQSFLQILPYITTDWRGFNSKVIFEKEIEFQGWNERKYMVIYRLAEKMKVGVKPELNVVRDGEEVRVPMTFPDGLKSLFIISDLAGELL
jgi:hypothetical protein